MITTYVLICIFTSLDEGIVDDVDNTYIQYSDDDVPHVVAKMSMYPDWIRIQLGQIRNPDPDPESQNNEFETIDFFYYVLRSQEEVMIEHAFDGADFGQDFQDIRHILGKQPSRKNNIEGYSRVLFGVLHTSTQTDSSMSSYQRILDDL